MNHRLWFAVASAMAGSGITCGLAFIVAGDLQRTIGAGICVVGASIVAVIHGSEL